MSTLDTLAKDKGGLNQDGFLNIPSIVENGIDKELFPDLLPSHIRRYDFSLLDETDRAYLDSAATTQVPQSVITQISEYRRRHLRGSNHSQNSLESRKIEERIAAVRRQALAFFGAHDYQIAFSHGTTSASNMLALQFPFQRGDLLLLTEAEHHSQILTPRNVARKEGVIIKYVRTSPDGVIDLEDLERKMAPHLQSKILLNLVHVSNVTGAINLVKEATNIVHQRGGYVYLDLAQSAGHIPISLADLQVDFAGVSAHKMYGPMGVGGLFVRKGKEPTFTNTLSGGSTVLAVSKNYTAYAPFPANCEPGTQNLEGILEWGFALDYLSKIGMGEIQAHDETLIHYFLNELRKIPQVQIYGPEKDEQRVAVVTFNIGSTAHNYTEVAQALDCHGISVRDGCFCAHLLIGKIAGVSAREQDQIVERIARGESKATLHLPGAVRASFAFYNNLEDAYRAVKAIREIARWYGK